MEIVVKCLFCEVDIEKELTARDAPQGKRYVCWDHHEVYDAVLMYADVDLSVLSDEVVLINIIKNEIDLDNLGPYACENDDYFASVLEDIRPMIESLHGLLDDLVTPDNGEWYAIPRTAYDDPFSEVVMLDQIEDGVNQLLRMGYTNDSMLPVSASVRNAIINPTTKRMKVHNDEIVDPMNIITWEEIDESYTIWKKSKMHSLIVDGI